MSNCLKMHYWNFRDLQLRQITIDADVNTRIRTVCKILGKNVRK